MTEKDFYRTMIKVVSAGFLLASACTAEAQVAAAAEHPPPEQVAAD